MSERARPVPVLSSCDDRRAQRVSVALGLSERDVRVIRLRALRRPRDLMNLAEVSR
jgi:hypothetical protein